MNAAALRSTGNGRSRGGELSSHPVCVVVTGPYGSGKTSLIEEMAGILERAGLSYAALDLDWFWWFEVSGISEEARRDVLMANLATAVDNYRRSGVERLLLAWAIKSVGDIARLERTLKMPLRIVRLTVPIEVIRQRLAPSATTDRQRDAQVAETEIAAGIGSDIGDIEIDNDRPLGIVAREVLDWLDWR